MKKNFLLKLLVLFILLLIYFMLSAFTYAEKSSENISNSVFRLHVIANSDSEEDQNLKYKVRDNLLNYMNTLILPDSTKHDTINIINDNIDILKSIAVNTVTENGYSYSVNLYVDGVEFPTKQYGDITLPEGNYDALKVEIGNATGENWWCVMFPPLCFTDVSTGIVPNESKENLSSVLDDNSYEVISNNSELDIEFKFKLLELFNY